MRPDNPRSNGPVVPQRQSAPSISDSRTNLGQTAAANVVRNQIDTIYDNATQDAPVASQPAPTPVAQTTEEDVPNPYERTHSEHAEVQAEQWNKYHSAWQEYYQKYYERYYIGQVYKARETLEANLASEKAKSEPRTATEQAEATFSRDEAMFDLRSKLLGKLQDSAKKVRKSRHFIPITAALCVVVLFLFLQYNRVLFANVQAYVSPGNIDPANIIIDPSTNVAVSPDPKLIIPKINVDVPVEYNVTPDYNAQMKAMENGVAWFGIPGANSKPGQVGNTVLSGHSSNDIIDQGSYKFIFARLDHLEKGDTIYVNYNSVRYSYTVTRKEVVKPTDVQKLVYSGDKPILTLITCTPLGTSLNRLLVTAEQVSPSPSDAQAAPEASTNTGETSIPGNSPTFLQRVFGGGEG
jgi:sortase A